MFAHTTRLQSSLLRRIPSASNTVVIRLSSPLATVALRPASTMFLRRTTSRQISSLSSLPLSRSGVLLNKDADVSSLRSLNSPSSLVTLRYFSSVPESTAKSSVEDPTATQNNTNNDGSDTPNRSVGYWLLTCAGMVFAMVVIGGITRLTESGLSIVEWKPITGAIPPRNEEEWAIEFNKYTQSPEFKRMNSKMGIEEFKSIFFWEYIHRLWGRTIGAAFMIPFVYFTVRGKIKVGTPLFNRCLGLLAGIGAQGALGWFMVKSGLEEPEDNSVPRVSPYRLASHLTCAIALYAGMAWVGLGLISPRIPSKNLKGGNLQALRRLAGLTLGMTSTTIVSGAFVAGRDAGFVYNNFPKMGDDWLPDEAFTLRPFWKNFFENDASVQFDHRVLAMSTLGVVLITWAVGRRRLKNDKRARLALNTLLAAGIGQVTLGIITLMSVVPVHLGAAHQAGSLTLLSVTMWLVHELKRLPK